MSHVPQRPTRPHAPRHRKDILRHAPAHCSSAEALKQHLIDHFNRKRYYEYHSGYRPVPPDHEQYIRQAILRYGWTEPVEFNAYVEDYLW